MTINHKNIDNIFYIFVTAHLIFWTLIPSITNHNLPLDTIEALAWGSNLDWGFNKHPPMSAFFTEVFFQIFGSNDWAYYLLSQIFVLITFFFPLVFIYLYRNKDKSLLIKSYITNNGHINNIYELNVIDGIDILDIQIIKPYVSVSASINESLLDKRSLYKLEWWLADSDNQGGVSENSINQYLSLIHI